jgi:hypothetical protein
MNIYCVSITYNNVDHSVNIGKEFYNSLEIAKKVYQERIKYFQENLKNEIRINTIDVFLMPTSWNEEGKLIIETFEMIECKHIIK